MGWDNKNVHYSGQFHIGPKFINHRSDPDKIGRYNSTSDGPDPLLRWLFWPTSDGGCVDYYYSILICPFFLIFKCLYLSTLMGQPTQNIINLFSFLHFWIDLTSHFFLILDNFKLLKGKALFGLRFAFPRLKLFGWLIDILAWFNWTRLA